MKPGKVNNPPKYSPSIMGFIALAVHVLYNTSGLIYYNNGSNIIRVVVRPVFDSCVLEGKKH